jgi:hypothetical protein
VALAPEGLDEGKRPVALLKPDGSLAAIGKTQRLDGRLVVQPTKVFI